MQFLKKIQTVLEDFYQAPTGLNILDFTISKENYSQKAELLVSKEPTKDDLDLAILFDRDLLSAWDGNHKNASICFEESSHFVYLSHNHLRRRNITPMEMELQSEIDRVLLAFHQELNLKSVLSAKILSDLYNSYEQETYENSRKLAVKFLRKLAGGNPYAWSESEYERLRKFFHCDLGEKIYLALKEEEDL